MNGIVKIDKLNRFVIPKWYRDKFGINTQTPMYFFEIQRGSEIYVNLTLESETGFGDFKIKGHKRAVDTVGRIVIPQEILEDFANKKFKLTNVQNYIQLHAAK